MTKASEYRAFIKGVRESPEHWKRFALTQFAVEVRRLMNAENLKANKLAARLGKTPPVLSKQLRGENLTVETMAQIASALGAAVHIHLAKKGTLVDWQEHHAILWFGARTRDVMDTQNMSVEEFIEYLQQQKDEIDRALKTAQAFQKTQLRFAKQVAKPGLKARPRKRLRPGHLPRRQKR